VSDDNDRELAELIGPCVLLSRVSDRTVHRIPQVLTEDPPALRAWLEMAGQP